MFTKERLVVFLLDKKTTQTVILLPYHTSVVGTHWKCLIKTFPMSATTNVFDCELRKILTFLLA